MNQSNLQIPDKKSGIFFEKKFANVNFHRTFTKPNNNTMTQFHLTVAPMQKHIGYYTEVQTDDKAEVQEQFENYCEKYNIDYSFATLLKVLHQNSAAEYSVGGVGFDARITLVAAP